MKALKSLYYSMGVSLTIGMMGLPTEVLAAPQQNNANNIAGNVVTSIANLPTLLSALSYLAGIVLGTLGVLKIKDHVEQPTQAQLKDGAIRLAAGGALLSLPIIFEAMSSAIGDSGGPSQATINPLNLGGTGSGALQATPTTTD